eukprot:NODE_10914_length_1321_cov_3.434673.p1 GENE.NODE_10914_length_1321_cov_3.434673~~NODE_10914_length_1321_cov_3.434673.p1  ORF type:complete len:432 (+),score=94.60 NODE_10914_length_1321_cov_3.434673:99-1298(+)
MKPRLAAKGHASKEFVSPRTLIDALRNSVARQGDTTIFRVERPCPALVDNVVPPPLPLDQWTSWTLKEAVEEIENVAKALIKFGFRRFDSLNVWGFNSPEWVMCIYAAAYAGGKIAGIYPSDTKDTAAYKVIHSNSGAVIVDDDKKVKKLVSGLEEVTRELGVGVPNIKCFVAWMHEPAENTNVALPSDLRVPYFSWAKFVERGKASSLDGTLEEIREATEPGHCAGLIYTSGTTGQPKAVMTSHDSNIYTSATVLDVLMQSTGLASTDSSQSRVLSYLPLSHVAGMMVDAVVPLLTPDLAKGHTIVHFARPYDLKVGALKDRLISARPTIFLGVPLVWEKIADKIRVMGAQTKGTKKCIATWAKGLGLKHAKNMQIGGSGRYSAVSYKNLTLPTNREV